MGNFFSLPSPSLKVYFTCFIFYLFVWFFFWPFFFFALLCFVLNTYIFSFKALNFVSFPDVSAPVFINCSNTIEVYADKGKTSAIVDWPRPTATDNSGFEPNVILPNKQPGAEFSSGVHVIIYKAEDKKGNLAECRFKVIVSGNTHFNRFKHYWEFNKP